MEIVTGSTGVAHVTPIDDAVRNSNTGYTTDKVVFTMYENLAAQAITANEVRVFSGYGMNQGRIFKIDADSYDSVTIENGASGTKRSDLIVARYTFDATTGFEDISLAVVKGTAGTDYADPTYTTGDINNGASQDDFPLYRVKIDGIVIDAVEQLFTLLPEGGRLGEVEEIATAARDTIAGHLQDKTNPHEVSGSQLTGAVPISLGGTGATTAAEAIQNLGIPSNVADAMAKTVYTDQIIDAVLVSKGGTGRVTFPSNAVLVGNGTSALTTRAIDATEGGTIGGTDIPTTGALYATKAALEMAFQAGVDTIYNAIVAEGVTPSSSTPEACATGIGTIATNNYDTGYSNGYAAKQSETYTTTPYSKEYIEGNASIPLEIDCTTAKSVTFSAISDGATPTLARLYYSTAAGNDWNLLQSSISLPYTISPSYKYYKMVLGGTGEGYLGVKATITNQYQSLR